MKKGWILIVYGIGLMLISGCASQPGLEERSSSSYIYPYSSFTSEKERVFVDELVSNEQILQKNLFDRDYNAARRAAITKESVLSNTYEFLATAGYSNREVSAWLADPFMTNKVSVVLYDSLVPAKKIAAYYTNAFLSNGWLKVRDGYPIELTLSGGDFINVYERDNVMLKLHICGPWEWDDTENNEERIVRAIILEFLGAKPKALLGKRYKKVRGPAGDWP